MKYLFFLLLLVAMTGCQTTLSYDPVLELEDTFERPDDFRKAEVRLSQVEKELHENRYKLSVFLDKDSLTLFEGLAACRLMTDTIKLTKEAGDLYLYLSDIYTYHASGFPAGQRHFDKQLEKNAGKPIMDCKITIQTRQLFVQMSTFKGKRAAQNARLYLEAAKTFKLQHKLLVAAYKKFREEYK